MISARALSGAKTLRWSAVLLLLGGPLLGQLFGSENRGTRLIGIALVLGGASTAVDAAIWMLSSPGF